MDMDGMITNDGGMTHDGMTHDGMANDVSHNMHGHEMVATDTDGSGTMSDMHNMHTGGMSHMMMMMYFHFTKDIPHLLFESWSIDAIGEFVGAIVFTVALAILYEGLKSGREYLMCVGLQSSHAQDSSEKKGDIELQDVAQKPRQEKRNKWHSLRHYTVSMTMHIIQSLLHVIQVGAAYILMLIAMTYNVWLFFAVIFGSGLGYLIFAKTRHLSSPFREQQDHCH